MADRPSKLTAEIATEICRLLADGENLRAICRDDGTPNERAARRWALDEKEFGDLYAQARFIGYASIFDQILEIADTPQIGTQDGDQGQRRDRDHCRRHGGAPN